MNLMPEKIAVQPDGSTIFKFPHEPFHGEHDGRYFVKGAISFPVYVEQTDRAEGWIIIAAQEIKSGEVVIVADTKWYTVDNIVEDGKIIHLGLESFFPPAWSTYGCKTFYHSDKLGTYQQYVLQITRNANIQPSPWLPEVEFFNQEDAINNLYAWRTRGKLILDDSGRLMKALLLWEQTGRKHNLPAVQALLTLVSAYERYPYRKMEEEL